MKRIICVLLLAITVPIIGMNYIKSLIYKPTIEMVEKAAGVSAVKPCIASIFINNEIVFTQIMNDLQNAANNSSVHGILLLIDNYGGSTGNYSAVHDMVKKVATMKPVVGLIVGNAFSGGYWVASACDYLICPSCSELGSIGSMYEITKYKDAKVTGNLEALLDIDVITAGEYKGLTHPHKAWTDKHRTFIKEHTQKMYMLFAKSVAQNRKLDMAKCEEWADAKVFLSPEALELGLVDQIGTIFEAEDKLRELIHARNPDIIFEKEITYLKLAPVQ